MGVTVEHNHPGRSSNATISPEATGSIENFTAPASNRAELIRQELRTESLPSFPALANSSSHSSLNNLSPAQVTEINAILRDIQQRQPHGVEMAREVIRDLTNPQEVNQGVHATCTMTTLQKQLAAENPVEYARMIRELTLTGKFTFNEPGSPTVTIDPVAMQKDSLHVPPPYEERSRTERMVQNVLMRYAIGETDQAIAAGKVPLHYDQANDRITGTYQGSQVSYQGLFQDQVCRAIQGVTGKKSEVIGSASEALPAIDRELKAGHSVMVELKWDAAGAHQLHALSVEHIDYEKGRVYLFNPHGAKSPPPEKGAIQSISLSEFKDKFECAFFVLDQKNDGRVPTAPAFDTIVQSQYGDNAPLKDAEGRTILNLQVKPPVANEGAESKVQIQTPAPSSPHFRIEAAIPHRGFAADGAERPAEAAAVATRPRGKAESTLFINQEDEERLMRESKRNKGDDPFEPPLIRRN